MQDEWRPTTDLTVNLGLRFDDAAAHRAYSPRANLVWQLPTGAAIHAGYARYVLPPSLDAGGESPPDLAHTTAAAPSPRGAPLRVETDDYFDLGLQQPLDHLVLGVDAYVRRAHDLLAEGEFGPAHLARSFNYARGQVEGLEVSATYADGPLTGWANLAATKGTGRRIVSNQFYFAPAQLAALADRDTPLHEDQRLTASGGVAYRRGRLTTSAQMLYGSGLPRTASGGDMNGARLPPYAQLDLSANYRMAGWREKPLQWRLDLFNAFDARYRLRDGTGLGDGAPLWGPRRGLFLGLEQYF